MMGDVDAVVARALGVERFNRGPKSLPPEAESILQQT
jgi:hypothetical protein